jgi:hypothetical protein
MALLPPNRDSTHSGDGSTAEAAAIDEDTLFEILGNERRRTCLKLLAQSDESWDVSYLSERVATDVTDEPSAAEEIYDSVYISLCQTHLPKLDKAGLVDYDAEIKTVTIGPAADSIRQYWFPEAETSTAPDTTPQRSLLVSVCTVVGLVVGTLVPSIAAPVSAVIVGLNLVALFSVAHERIRASD